MEMYILFSILILIVIALCMFFWNVITVIALIIRYTIAQKSDKSKKN